MIVPSVPPEAPVTPVTTLCIENASKAYDVPVLLIAGVMAQESGKVGRYTANSNGSYDFGPMQINSTWLPALAQQGISASAIMNDGCLNVFIGTAILKKHGNATGNQWWKAAGNYHSKTPSLHDKYLYKVANKISKIMSGQLTVNQILNNANGS